MITTFIQNVKRADTPAYAKIKKILKSILRMNVPSIAWIHRPLYTVHLLLTRVIPEVYSKVWVAPIFKAFCVECGTSLKINNGMPYVEGNPNIFLGDNVTISRCTISSGHRYQKPKLRVGNHSVIGYGNTISCSQAITIGDNVLIASNCFIADNNGHPLDPEKRRKHLPVDKEDISPVTIGNNVWLGYNCVILKGVTIGDNCIIAANTVISKSIPANSIVRPPTNSLIKNYPRFL